MPSASHTNFKIGTPGLPLPARSAGPLGMRALCQHAASITAARGPARGVRPPLRALHAGTQELSCARCRACIEHFSSLTFQSNVVAYGCRHSREEERQMANLGQPARCSLQYYERPSLLPAGRPQQKSKRVRKGRKGRKPLVPGQVHPEHIPIGYAHCWERATPSGAHAVYATRKDAQL